MGFFSDVAKAAVDFSTGGLSNKDMQSMIPGIGDRQAQQEANKQNVKLALANRDWMERMSNTAYQRAMDDMKKAGLNPMLAYQQGGASVPSSTAPTVGAASATGLLDAGVKAFTGISNSRTAQQQANTAQAQAESSIQLQTAQAAKEVAQTENAVADTKVKQAEAQLKARELRGKGAKDVLNIRGGKIIDKIFNTIENSAKGSASTKNKVIKVLGIQDNDDKPLIKKPY